ncbi:MAG: hypothetical protein B7Z66_11235 [Chromatiales bacterium 21-64-14]|nr:MAG: hypothetical protein B7Z66_11235 [Chromatiales bacterium 21-64-14]HQU16765.1 glycosyltransferase family 39 protein [Gammaproteobacteria bacterium]
MDKNTRDAVYIGRRPTLPTSLFSTVSASGPNVKTKSLLPFLFVMALALIPRVIGIGAYLVADEQLWIVRSIRFLHALLSGDFPATNQAGHPGVITMWLGALFIGLRTLLGPYVWLKDFMWPAQFAVAITTAACIAAMFLLLRRISGLWVAGFSVVFLICDPFYLALSRIFHVDALLASLMCVSVLLLIAAMEEPERGRSVLLASGAFAGLALLEKLPGVYLLPFSAALVLFYPLILTTTNSNHPRAYVMRILPWSAAAAAVIYLLWPALWSDPLILFHSVEQAPAIAAHANGQFFLGQPERNPGGFFYPTVLLFRSTPLSLILAIGTSVLILYRWLSRRVLPQSWERLGLVLLLYMAGFMLMMSFGAKKMDRYLLPVFPALDILAAIGAAVLFKALRCRLNTIAWKTLGVAVLAGLGVIMLAPIVRLYPYYLSYYSPLAGGPRAAVRFLLVGRGEGLDQVAHYLNSLPDARRITVATEFPYLLQPLFHGHVMSTQTGQYKPLTLERADYLVVYISGRQEQELRLPEPVIRYYQTHQPILRIVINHIDYADIYKLRSRVPQPRIDTPEMRRHP